MTDYSSSATQATTIVFDWGDTLMQVFPQYEGPMVDWPQVAAVDGAAPALELLRGRYRLVVASNASDSSASLIRSALGRVGLDSYFDAIYTFHELKSRKPDLAFFQRLEQLLQEQPDNLLMVGNDWRADVLSAHRAGWYTIWLNHHCLACPALLPLHNQEVHRMDDLPAALERLTLPSWETCCAWLLEQPTSANLWRHVQTVAAVAYQLALWLRAAGQQVDPLLAQRGGMLHDLAKIATRYANPDNLNHGELAARFLAKRGHPALAEIARRHLLFGVIEEDRQPRTWEEKVVYFADKLVESSRLVKIEERLQALRQRYMIDESRLNQLTPALYRLQDDFCTVLQLSSEALNEKLRVALLGGESQL